MPLSSSASKLSDLQIQLINLQSQLAALKANQATTKPAISSASYCPTLSRTLSRGSKGNDVSSLQQFLISGGFLTAGNNTGYFGPITEAAVKQWQKEHNIISSGSSAMTGYGAVGPKTRAAIACPKPYASAPASAPVITRALGKGMSGSDVTALQKFLIAHGLLAAGNDTGYFGTLTEAVVKSFQSRNNIVSSGTPATTGYGAVGPKTRAAIVALSRSTGANIHANTIMPTGGDNGRNPAPEIISHASPSPSPTPVPAIPYMAPEFIVTLTAEANQKYVYATIDGSRDLLASKSGVSTWETFDKVDAGDGAFALQSRANGKYVSVRGDDILYAEADSIGPWERFRQIDTGDGCVALQSLKNNMYVSPENAGASSLRANRSSIGEREKFVVSRVVDMWKAATSFAVNFPGKIKITTDGRGILRHTEKMEGNTLWMMEYFGFDPNAPGEVVWNDYGLQMMGDWDVFTSWGTYGGAGNGHPGNNAATGASWNIPRSIRYAIPELQQDSPVATSQRYGLGAPDCSKRDLGQAPEWGRHTAAYMRDFGADVGRRWVIDVSYKDSNEMWTLDLGPQEGVFAPVFGVLGYGEGPDGERRFFAHIDDSPGYVWAMCH